MKLIRYLLLACALGTFYVDAADQGDTKILVSAASMFERLNRLELNLIGHVNNVDLRLGQCIKDTDLRLGQCIKDTDLRLGECVNNTSLNLIKGFTERFDGIDGRLTALEDGVAAIEQMGDATLRFLLGALQHHAMRRPPIPWSGAASPDAGAPHGGGGVEVKSKHAVEWVMTVPSDKSGRVSFRLRKRDCPDTRGLFPSHLPQTPTGGTSRSTLENDVSRMLLGGMAPNGLSSRTNPGRLNLETAMVMVAPPGARIVGLLVEDVGDNLPGATFLPTLPISEIPAHTDTEQDDESPPGEDDGASDDSVRGDNKNNDDDDG